MWLPQQQPVGKSNKILCTLNSLAPSPNQTVCQQPEERAPPRQQGSHPGEGARMPAAALHKRPRRPAAICLLSRLRPYSAPPPYGPPPPTRRRAASVAGTGAAAGLPRTTDIRRGPPPPSPPRAPPRARFRLRRPAPLILDARLQRRSASGPHPTPSAKAWASSTDGFPRTTALLRATSAPPLHLR